MANNVYNPTQLNYGSSTYKAPGANVFGSNVSPVAMPNPAADLGGQFANLSGTNNSISSMINGQLNGQLSPDTIDAIRNQGAAWGVSAGMPGSQSSSNNMLKNLGLNTMQVQQQGLQNYNSTIPTISKTQTVDPSLQADVNLQNNVNSAAPNPTAAGTYSQSLFQSYLDKLSGKSSTPTVRGGGAVAPVGTTYTYGSYGPHS
jgi:hypothetical protein